MSESNAFAAQTDVVVDAVATANRLGPDCHAVATANRLGLDCLEAKLSSQLVPGDVGLSPLLLANEVLRLKNTDGNIGADTGSSWVSFAVTRVQRWCPSGLPQPSADAEWKALLQSMDRGIFSQSAEELLAAARGHTNLASYVPAMWAVEGKLAINKSLHVL